MEKVSEGGPTVAVSIGSKMRLKDGATCCGIEKAQVVTVNRAPFDVNGHACVTFKERPGTFLLDDFREVGKNDPGLAVLGESPDACVSPELAAAVRDLRDALAPLRDSLEREVARIGNAIATSREILSITRKRRTRQHVAPPTRRSRK